MKRIVVASLVPHAGHLSPSLRIAAALSRGEIEVVVVAPEEARKLMDRLPTGYSYQSIGSVMPTDSAYHIARWAGASPLSRQLYINSSFDKRYLLPLTLNGFRLLPLLKERVTALAPDLIIADDHLFRGAYAELAQYVGAPLVLNRSNGSHYPAQPLYGVPWRRDNLWSLTARRFARVASAVENRALRLRDPSWHGKQRAMLQELRGYWERAVDLSVPHEHVFWVSCGLSALEAELLETQIVPDNSVAHFGPLPSFAWQVDSRETLAWIDADSRPVLLVGFGTMAPGMRLPIEVIAREAAESGFRTLYASASRPSNVEPSDNFLWSAWIDQAAILKHPSVRLFISHCGSGAMQDALLGGVPMICHPMDGDTRYNAWVVTQLDSGIWPTPEHIFSSRLNELIRNGEAKQARAIELRDRAVELNAAQQLSEAVMSRWGLT